MITLEKKAVFKFSNIFMLLVFFALASTTSFAQNQCLTKAEVDRVVQSVGNSIKPKKNKKIRRELLKMQEKQIILNQQITIDPKPKFIKKLKNLSKQNLLRLCELYKQNGWLDEKAIRNDGLAASLYIIRNSSEYEIVKELFPIITKASKKGYIPKADLATLIDKIRITTNGTQVFGTQITIRDEVGYLYPLENNANVDKWRKLYELPTLSKFIKLVESQYRTIVVKMPKPPTLKVKSTLNISQNDENEVLGLTADEDEILNIESSLVNLNVRVLTKNLFGTRNLDLKKEDFQIYENGKKQEISFFTTTDTPIDLILLLDLSGSTNQKRILISEAARHFIKLARPKDRIAIVSFASYPTIVSEFTNNKKELFEKVLLLNDYGSSKVWDALDFTYKKLLKKKEDNKRSAIVFMTDGVDNTLVQNPLRPDSGSRYYSMRPSKKTFTELLETVRKNDANIFSIYLDTEYLHKDRFLNKKSHRQARRTLKMLSEESGGQYYRAERIENLNGIYEKIINDLSEVYSLGYEPKGESQSGTWRELKIRIKDRPNLVVKSKRGYYAK